MRLAQGRTTRGRHLAVLAAIARREWLLQMVALAATGCRRGDDRAYSRSTTATIAYEESALNSSYDESDKRLVFLPLVVENETGELEGRLAERWTHSTDYREWTYHLRPGLRWHDGVPVTAHDLKFSLDLLAHPDILAFGPKAFESATVLDDLTVTIRTGRIESAEAYNTWPICYPKHRLERLDPKQIADWEFWTHPIGNGPYRFVRYLPHTMIEYEANPDYYGGSPKIKYVVLKFAKNSSLTELLSGNVDSTDLDPGQVTMLGRDPRFRVYHSLNGNHVLTIYWQHGNPFFHDRRVRLALTLAINRAELRQVLRVPDTIRLVDGPFSHRQLRRGELPEAIAQDPARARALLDEAGWRNLGADRVREREGRPFRFTAIVRENVPGNQAAAVYVQDQLRRVGIGMEVQLVQQGNIYAQMRSGRFEAALVPSGSTGPPLFGERSSIGYSNTAAARLIDRLEATLDPDARDAIYRELTAICRAEVPVTFLCPWVGTTVAHRRLQGLSSPWRVDPVQHMEDLWIEE